MAKALGAAVYPGGGKEIGWAPLLLTEAGRASCLAHLAPHKTAVLHWHGDTFDLPAGTSLLASTARYPNQAFAHGRSVALQFHPEVTQPGLERWFIGHACEIAATDGVDVAGLRRDTAREAPRLARQGTRFLDAWLRAAIAS
jgi:GMP synthase (glutamine-hydrolysing)